LRMEKIECYVPIRGSPCIKTSIRQEAVHARKTRSSLSTINIFCCCWHSM
jgi:hypothetical protein